MAPIPRRTERQKHLSAPIVPVEQAFLYLDRSARNQADLHDVSHVTWLAGEFRAVAEELHWW